MKHLILTLLVAFTSLHLSAQLDFKPGFLIVPPKFTFDDKHAYTYQVKELLERESPKAFKEYRSGMRLKNVGTGLFALSAAAGIVSMGINLGVNYGEYEANPLDLIIFVPAAAGIILNASSNGRFKQSVKTFNREYYQDSGFILQPAVTQNGIGLVLSF